MSDQRAGDDVRREAGMCAVHGGLMWSNAMRACITTDDVIRGGCEWRALEPEAIGMALYGEVTWDDEAEEEIVRPIIGATPGTAVYVDSGCVDE